jgi:flavin reductase (DIM6/NTAB) family NADH-FMN oxidoreductase RutF
MTLDMRAFFDMSYGLYILGSFEGNKLNAMIANSVVQVTADPAMIAVSINKDALTHDYVKKSGYFSVQPIKESADMMFIGNFGFRTGRDFDKFAKYKYKTTQSKLPVVLEQTLDVFEVKTENIIDLGTHTMFIGKVISDEVLEEGKALTYSYYQTVLRGKTPRGATTYKEEKK